MWIAVDGNGDLWGYSKKPIWDKEQDCWLKENDSHAYYFDKTLDFLKILGIELSWKDKPIEIGIVQPLIY